MSDRVPYLINSSITKRFVPVVVGGEGYKHKTDKDAVSILARLKAESELTPERWNLFGYGRSPARDYYRENLSGDIDAVFIAQTDDEAKWRRRNLEAAGDVFDYENHVGEPCPETWYLSVEEKNHWFKEVPRFFQIWGDRGKVYWGLVIKNLRLFEYDERRLDSSSCSHFRTRKTLSRLHRGRYIFEVWNEKGSDEQSLIPVIAQAKLVPPYTVKLVHPEDYGRL